MISVTVTSTTYSTTCSMLGRWPPAYKPVAIGHFYLWQRFGVQHGVLWNDAVDRQEIRSQGVDFVICQRLRRLYGHGATHIIENRGRTGPVRHRSFDRL